MARSTGYVGGTAHPRSRARFPKTRRMELDGTGARSPMRVGLRRSGLGRRCRLSFLALVERARTTMTTPRPQERKNLARGWELRGLMRCPSCGGAMGTHTAKRGDKLYHYYRCHRSVDYRRGSCR